MPRLAALALLLAFGTSAFASIHPQHSTSLSSAHHSLRAAGFHKAIPARILATHNRATTARLERVPSHQSRGHHQVSQHPTTSGSRRSPLTRVAHTRSERTSRHPRHLPTRQGRPVSVVSLIRSTSEHPRLPDLTEAVSEPILLPQLHDARGHLMVPAALVGSHAILLHQNQMAEIDGLGRVQNDEDLEAMRQHGMLVALPTSAALSTDERLPYNRRYARPWTASFLNDLARAHYARFHSPLQVNSAVRTVEFQQHLLHINGNAAPADGDTASPHLTGQAIDLAKRGMPIAEIAWIRGYLLPLVQVGKIDVEEEFKQSCFHISVYRRYSATAAERYVATSREGASPLTAVLR